MTSKSKQVTLSQAFRVAAATDEVGALAFMLMSAFGTSLSTCVAVVDRALLSGDKKIVVLMLTSGVQVRGNVVFVGRDYAGIQQVYPELVITGGADRSDIFNFSALHVCGHILARVMTHAMGGRMLAKAGDCTSGEKCPDSEAGRINKEVADSWSSEEKMSLVTKITALRTTHGVKLDGFVVEYIALSASFMTKMNPPAGSASTKA